MRRKSFFATILISALFIFLDPAFAQEAITDEVAELAKKLANPVASMISIPIQYNYDAHYGANNKGSRNLVNIQPVIPFSITKDWNLITRIIVPLVDYNDMPSLSPDEGMGDITQSFFFSPKETVGGWILGLGPVFSYPTATDSALGSEKWGAGPTVVMLQQKNSWTYGMLANHISSFAGEKDRDDVNATFLQPFLSYLTKTKTTLGIGTESTYNWVNEEWSVPIIYSVSQLVKVGKLPVQLSFGIRQWLDTPSNQPEDIGYRFGVTFLLPTGE